MKENLKYTKAPSIIWRLSMTQTEKILLFNLAYLESENTIKDKSQALLAHITGTSIPSVNRCLANLEKNGWIIRTKMFAQCDKYTIVWDKIIKEATETDFMAIKNNITEEEIQEIMGTYIGELKETKEVKTDYDFNEIDSKIPTTNKHMALRQTKPYLSKEENIRRLSDALSIFLRDYPKDIINKYYHNLLAA